LSNGCRGICPWIAEAARDLDRGLQVDVLLLLSPPDLLKLSNSPEFAPVYGRRKDNIFFLDLQEKLQFFYASSPLPHLWRIPVEICFTRIY
jgi:hypothetical protein